MSVLEVSNLKFSYGDKNLFNSLNMRLFNNDHLGLVGLNGVGKSTFLKLLARKLSPDEGKITWGDVSYSYLDQHLHISEDVSISEYLYAVYADLFAIEKEINKLYKSLETTAADNYAKILKKADNLNLKLEENDFYLIKSKIENVLTGLGINMDLDFLLKNLSGGQRVKVFLAKMLLEEKDVLLLDEPTNFLDALHIEWLGKYLVNYPRAFIVISHNKSFLNLVSNKIAEIDNKELNIYKGNYDIYLKQKELNAANYQKRYISQQKEIKKTQEFIQKNIARDSTSKQAKSRRRQLAKLDVLEKPTTKKKVVFDFPFTRSFNKEVLIIKDLEIGYNKVLLPKINLRVEFGERLAIRGKNGVGKTTFIKTLLGIVPKISGKMNLSKLNDVVYYSQEFVPPDNLTPIEFIQADYPLMGTKEVRDLLARYGITQELALKTLDKLSGGELTKVRFALLSLSESNLLILDEPTNHLDMIAKKALFKALNCYPGTIILVSHEKEFYKDIRLKEIIFG